MAATWPDTVNEILDEIDKAWYRRCVESAEAWRRIGEHAASGGSFRVEWDEGSVKWTLVPEGEELD